MIINTENVEALLKSMSYSEISELSGISESMVKKYKSGETSWIGNNTLALGKLSERLNNMQYIVNRSTGKVSKLTEFIDKVIKMAVNAWNELDEKKKGSYQSFEEFYNAYDKNEKDYEVSNSEGDVLYPEDQIWNEQMLEYQEERVEAASRLIAMYEKLSVFLTEYLEEKGLEGYLRYYMFTMLIEGSEAEVDMENTKTLEQPAVTITAIDKEPFYKDPDEKVAFEYADKKFAINYYKEIDFRKMWASDLFFDLDSIGDPETDSNGNFIDKDGNYIQVDGYDTQDQLDRAMREDYEDFLLNNHYFQKLTDEQKDKWWNL